MGVFLARLNGQTEFLREVKFMAKMSGAVGNFNAHFAAYPEVDWFALSRKVLEDRLGVTFNPVTTQIEPHDNLADLLDIFSRISTILIDFARDIWLYISMNYFGQKLNIGEVGSSTMPHKVNPIDFENAEGNLLLARNLLRFLADKLPLSRLQRDLTDSTVLRNLGQAFAYLFIAFASLEKGMGKLKVNREVIAADLENHYEVLAEPVQTVMKRYGIGDAYEQLKELTRGEKITREKLQSFISGLNIPEKAKEQLLSLTPEKYTGIVK
jgi:adenylosuccinate lyase